MFFSCLLFACLLFACLLFVLEKMNLGGGILSSHKPSLFYGLFLWMVVSLFLFSSPSLVRSEEVFDVVFDAFDDCPCINPWENYTNPDGDDDCVANRLSDGTTLSPTCYNRSSYGVDRCGLWDKGLGSVCAQANPPTYCISAFCYVDTNNCKRPSNVERGSLLDRALGDISGPTDHLAYSYETCGYLDRFSTNQQAANELAGRTLRVSFPLPGSVGTFFSFYDESDNEYRGAVHEFMNGVLDELDVELQVVNLSTQSLERFPTTSFTACVHDVALNNTDFCISDFWITPQRRLMTTFTEQFEEDLFYLYVPANGDEDIPFSEILANPFRPFHRDVWLLIVAFLFFTAFCYLLLEFHNSDDFVDHDNIVSKFYHSSYQAFQSYASASSIHAPKKKSTKMLLVGFGFFVLVMVSSYTAELASFFIRDDAGVAIDSFEAGLASGYKICGYTAVRTDFLDTYPTAESAYVEVGTGGEAVEKLAAGECDMVMLAIEDWEASQALRYDNIDPDFLCSLRRVGEPLLTVGIANPIQAEYEPAISWMITRLKNEFVRDRVAAKSEFLGDSTCTSIAEGSEDEQEQLDLEDMGGVFFIALLFYIVAGLMHVVGVFCFDKDPEEKDLIKEAVLAALHEYYEEGSSFKKH